jgi:hypothetical protein
VGHRELDQLGACLRQGEPQQVADALVVAPIGDDRADLGEPQPAGEIRVGAGEAAAGDQCEVVLAQLDGGRLVLREPDLAVPLRRRRRWHEVGRRERRDLLDLGVGATPARRAVRHERVGPDVPHRVELGVIQSEGFGQLPDGGGRVVHRDLELVWGERITDHQVDQQQPAVGGRPPLGGHAVGVGELADRWAGAAVPLQGIQRDGVGAAQHLPLLGDDRNLAGAPLLVVLELGQLAGQLHRREPEGEPICIVVNTLHSFLRTDRSDRSNIAAL